MSSSYRTAYRSVEIVTGPAFWPSLGWTLACVLAQTTLVPYAAFRGAVPSLPLIAVVLYASRVGARRGALLGIIVGALEDIFAGTGGAWTLSTTLIALAVGGLSRRTFVDGAFLPGVLCALAMLVRDLMFWSVMRLEGYPPGFAVAHVHNAGWRALLTALAAFVFLTIRGRLVVDKTTIQRFP